MMVFEHKYFNFLLFTVLLVATVDLAILPWYFPPTEGWWETYAWLMASEHKLYKEVWLAFPPLQIVFMRLQMSLFGHDFLILRLIGVVTHSITVSLLYLWLKRLTSAYAAFIGALLSTLLIIYTNTAYIVRDYHTTVELFEVLALFCSAKFLMAPRAANQIDSRINLGYSFGILGAGLACGGLILTKQNIGVFFTLFLGMAIFFRALYTHHKPNYSSAIFTGVIFAIACGILPILITIWMGSDWISVYINNSSKGGVGLVLTRFIVSEDCRKVLVATIVITILFSRIRKIDYVFGPVANYFKIKDSLCFLFCHVISRSIIFILFCFLYKIGIGSIIFSFSFYWLLQRTVLQKNNKDDNDHTALWCKFGWLPLLGLAYCGTQTAGYNFTSMQLILALMIADLSGKFYYKCPEFLDKFNFLFFGLTVTFLVLTLKLTGDLYNWWGTTQGNFNSAKYSLPFKELRGFRVNKNTANIFGEVAKYKSILKEDETVFAYPSIPLIYLLLNKIPPIKTPILWFDVSQASQEKEIISDLELSKPTVIFWLKPPLIAYQSHFILRKQPSLINSVDNWIYRSILAGEYNIENVITENIILFENDVFESEEVSLILTKRDLSIKDILKLEGVEEIESINNVNVNVNVNVNAPINILSVVKIRFSNNSYMKKNSGKIGFYFSNEKNNFIVLKRTSTVENKSNTMNLINRDKYD